MRCRMDIRSGPGVLPFRDEGAVCSFRIYSKYNNSLAVCLRIYALSGPFFRTVRTIPFFRICFIFDLYQEARFDIIIPI